VGNTPHVASYIMSVRVSCRQCGASILPATAERTGGLCMACKQGIRQAIDDSKRFYQEQGKPNPFDELWKSLVHRVYRRGEDLTGAEDTVYRLTCIYGETMVDGIEAYFERRFPEYERDMRLLTDCGFGEVAGDFSKARNLLFGPGPLSAGVVLPVVARLLDEKKEDRATLAALGAIYDRLISSLPGLLAYRDSYAQEKLLLRWQSPAE
jgi:hypothetical protein